MHGASTVVGTEAISFVRRSLKQQEGGALLNV